MLRLTEIPAYGHGGLVVTVLAVLAWLLTARTRPPPISPAAVYAVAALAAVPALAELLLTTWYLFSPTYIDHIEASTASLTQYFRQGVAVYPDLSSYTFHGLLYGPLLAELSSLGYLFGSGVFASKLIGWLAAWLAVGLLLLAQRPADRNWAWAASLACVLCVLSSFGSVLTANRADSLLLLCATAGLFCVIRVPGLAGLAMAALLAGAAADLKVHGPVYVAPALFWWASENPDRRPTAWLAAVLVALAAGMAGIGLPFLPANVSLAGYLSYLGLAAKHGLDWSEFGWNCAFVASLWAPPLLVVPLAPRARPPTPRLRSFAGLLLALELAVAVIASKPGAGLHHLLPFLGFHAFLLQRALTAASAYPGDEQRAERAAIAAMAVVLLGTAWPAAAIFRHLLVFDLQLPRQEATHAELAQLAGRYPRGMLGISDAASYGLTSFRPWLTLAGTRQTDYGALMDLKLSGVSDAPLASALAHCEIPYLFMPKEGQPFAMQNRYGGPLFSDAVRTGFSQRYSLLETGRDFNVYGCENLGSN